MIENPRYKRVQLFVTCLVDAFFPETGMSVVRLLEYLGFEVEFPQAQTCCGQIAFNAGVWDDARKMARHNIDLLAQTDGYIVLPSGSCTDMMTHHYAELFADDLVYGPKVIALKERTFELTQFLVDELQVTDLQGKLNGRVTYHPSCHGLRNLGLRDQSTTLLEAVEGLEFVPLPEADVCCGFGGLFAVKMGEISGMMLQRKLENVSETDAETLVGSDVSCLMHMGGGLQKRGSAVQTEHIADVLCRACGLNQ
ncbi:MAG: (Fe-S)-binding protein [Ardenticatenaceae bacterium]|nr:(Fe-S)-binding protein [Ardenticatenaceae bacterium]